MLFRFANRLSVLLRYELILIPSFKIWDGYAIDIPHTFCPRVRIMLNTKWGLVLRITTIASTFRKSGSVCCYLRTSVFVRLSGYDLVSDNLQFLTRRFSHAVHVCLRIIIVIDADSTRRGQSQFFVIFIAIFAVGESGEVCDHNVWSS